MRTTSALRRGFATAHNRDERRVPKANGCLAPVRFAQFRWDTSSEGGTVPGPNDVAPLGIGTNSLQENPLGRETQARFDTLHTRPIQSPGLISARSSEVSD